MELSKKNKLEIQVLGPAEPPVSKIKKHVYKKNLPER